MYLICLLLLGSGLLGKPAPNRSVPSINDVLVGTVVPATERLALSQIDHTPWDTLLQKYVEPTGLVNYRAWLASAADVTALDDYLRQLSRTDEQGTAVEQLAYWINAYNAVTIRGILREYPTSSIRNHTARFIGYNIWKNLKLYVNGRQVSLDEMEHEILRKMQEPRIHFAIVCASLGCPKLLNRAYLPGTLEQQLADNTRAFFSDSSKLCYDAANRTFYCSPILDWFKEDFGGDQAARLKRIAPWLSDPTAAQAAAKGTGTLVYLDYNWDLNDQQK